MHTDFYSPYTHGFVRTAVCLPRVRVADPVFNTDQTLELAQQASASNAAIALFPELGLSAYSNDDLFQQSALQDAVVSCLQRVVDASVSLSPVLLVGAPLVVEGKLFNCAVAIYQGRVLAVVPKLYLPNYREFYEKRQFTSGRNAIAHTATVCGQSVPFGTDIVLDAVNVPNFKLHVEICEDLWAPLPPSTFGAMAGATILANLSASNITIGKSEYRKALCSAHSGRLAAAYLYSAAGYGESTTDLAWDGQGLIYENGELLAEASRFSMHPQMISADIDTELLVQERTRWSTFNDCSGDHLERLRQMRTVEFTWNIPADVRDLRRVVPRFPYVPDDPALRNERCYEAYNIQVQGLAKRLDSTSLSRVVIGVSGGLDSTHALIVAARAMDQLGLPRSQILAYTMPGFATSSQTLKNAHALMAALGVTASEIDIRPSCMQMLQDINHPFVGGHPVYDITFENVQAGERTSHLFRLANYNNALVVGTGDLSELALGWATYGVGDHMSHYNVNASVSKTLIQYLIRWVVGTNVFTPDTSAILQSILETEISPELVPASDDTATTPAQRTEDVIGPYELQDFNLYYITRHGFAPSKVAYLSWQAWGDAGRGTWPDSHPGDKRNAYELAAIKHWLRVFVFRFFKTSQFKRSCIPNGPKVGSGGSLSPRGDWRTPSDSEATVWLDELQVNVPGDA